MKKSIIIKINKVEQLKEMVKQAIPGYQVIFYIYKSDKMYVH